MLLYPVGQPLSSLPRSASAEADGVNKAEIAGQGCAAAWGWASVCGACSATCTFVPEPIKTTLRPPGHHERQVGGPRCGHLGHEVGGDASNHRGSQVVQITWNHTMLGGNRLISLTGGRLVCRDQFTDASAHGPSLHLGDAYSMGSPISGCQGRAPLCRPSRRPRHRQPNAQLVSPQPVRAASVAILTDDHLIADVPRITARIGHRQPVHPGNRLGHHGTALADTNPSTTTSNARQRPVEDEACPSGSSSGLAWLSIRRRPRQERRLSPSCRLRHAMCTAVRPDEACGIGSYCRTVQSHQPATAADAMLKLLPRYPYGSSNCFESRPPSM